MFQVLSYYAVGPAHMMFPSDTNQNLQRGVGLPEIRDRLNFNPPDSLYAIQFHEPHGDQNYEEGETRIFYAKNPPMIGYRYRIAPENDTTVEHQFFMNDIVLLRLKESDAKEIKNQQKLILPTRRKRMISIDTPNKLGAYMRPTPNREIKILVRGFSGRLIANRFGVEQLRSRGWSYYLLFILDNE